MRPIVNRLARNLRRRDNIIRRLSQLEHDFEASNSVEAELRINEEIARQNLYLARAERRLVGTTRV